MKDLYILTVSQLNTYVKAIIDENPMFAGLYVEGEISNFTDHYKSGHLYLTLKDEKSLIKAVMFKSYASRLKFKPENGMKVIVRARLSVYERDGLYQLYIEEMHPSGLGDLHVAFEQLKKKLSREGLFDSERKKPLPAYPEKIAIITSETGAAVEDMKNVLSRRYPVATLVMSYVLVQGKGAPLQIIEALDKTNKTNAADVIILGRGGGSIEELWAFNDEGVARAIAASQIPVISAVGHETDFTIADLVADLRAPTPSAAAELVAPDIRAIKMKLEHSCSVMLKAIDKKISYERNRLQILKNSKPLSSPALYIENKKIAIDSLTDKMYNTFKEFTSVKRAMLSALAGKLNVLSPLQILSRGYAIAYHNNEILKSITQVDYQSKIKVKLTDGEIESKVCKISGGTDHEK